MSASRTLRVEILGDARSAQNALKLTGDEAGRLEGIFGRVGGAFEGMGGKLAGLAAGFVAFQGFQALRGAVSGLVADAQESAKVAAQLDAVLKSTGGAAGLTAADINDLTDALSALTGIDDEAITSAQAVLLTFTNIGKNVFPDATKAIVDLSAALGGDMQGAAIQIGKALNDPIAGITALTRVGVSFTEQQKDMIAAMVEAGDVAGAQRLILAELAKEFGGSAEAQATNVKRLTVAWGNFREELGGALLPIIEQVAGALNTMLRSDATQAGLQRLTAGITALAGTGNQLLQIFARRDFVAGGWLSEDGPITTGLFAIRDGLFRARDAIGILNGVVQDTFRAFGGGEGDFRNLAATLALVDRRLAPLARGLQLAKDSVLTFRQALAGDWFRGGSSNNVVNQFGALGLAIGNVVRAVRPFVPQIMEIARAFRVLAAPFASFLAALVRSGGDARKAFDSLRGTVTTGLGTLRDLLVRYGPQLAAGLWSFVKDAAGDFKVWWQKADVIGKVAAFLRAELPKLATGAGNLAGKLWDGLGDAVAAFREWWQRNDVTGKIVTFLKDRLGALKDGAGDLAGKIWDGVGDIPGALATWWGQNDVGGKIKDRLGDLLGEIGDVAGNLWSNLTDVAGKFGKWWQDNGVASKIAASLSALLGDLGDFGAELWSNLGDLAQRFKDYWQKNDIGGKINAFLLGDVGDWVAGVGTAYGDLLGKELDPATFKAGQKAGEQFGKGFADWLTTPIDMPALQEWSENLSKASELILVGMFFGPIGLLISNYAAGFGTGFVKSFFGQMIEDFKHGPSVEDVGNQVIAWFTQLADWLATKVPALASWDALGKAIGDSVFKSLPRWLQDFINFGPPSVPGQNVPGGQPLPGPTPAPAPSTFTPGNFQSLTFGGGGALAQTLEYHHHGDIILNGMTYEEGGVMFGRAMVGEMRRLVTQNGGGGGGLTAGPIG